MGYAIVGYFDSDTDKKIKRLWQGMADSEVCNYLINSANNPHIKFAMFDFIDVEAVKRKLEQLTKTTRQIDVHFKSYSFYPILNPFFCIDIAVTKPILELHSQILKECSEYTDDNLMVNFKHGVWKPDCQLTIRFDKSKLVPAVNYLSETQLPFDGKLEKIGLIEFHPAKQMFSYELL